MSLSSRNFRRLIILNIIFAIFIFLFIIFILPKISPAFNVGSPSHSISKAYGPNFSISGWVNMSFEDEPLDSSFLGSFDGGSFGSTEFTLEELLEVNPGHQHSCIPIDCEKDYSKSVPQNTKAFSLPAGGEKIIGLHLGGQISGISSINFEIQSNAPANCVNQLNVDILDNGEIDLINNKIGSGICYENNYGCFDNSHPQTEFSLGGGSSYCQRVNLSEHPGFRVGAWIKKVSGGLTITASLRELNGVERGWCEISGITSTTGAEYFCNIDYAIIEEKEYYVCIHAAGEGSYRIRGYASPEPLCGFPGYPPKTETAAYQIFARGRQFGAWGTINVSETLPSGVDLSQKVYQYLSQRYGVVNSRIDCAEGCIVPIRITSPLTQGQTVTLRNLNLIYQTTAGDATESSFYDLTESPPKITSSSQRLFLDGVGIKTPDDFSNYSFDLTFKGESVIDNENIEVKNVPIINSLIPTSTASSLPTKFSVEVTTPENVSITSYKWDFLNNEGFIDRTETTYTDEITHTYYNIGTHSLRVSVTDNRGLVSPRTFQVEVESPKEMINITINKIEQNIQNINSFVSDLQAFERTAILSTLNLENISSRISTLKQEYHAALTPEDNLLELNRIMTELSGFRVPDAILTSSSVDSLVFIPKSTFINVNAIEQIGGPDTYGSGSSEDYKQAILGWQTDNLNLTIGFKKFSGDYDGSINHLTSIFEIRMREIIDINYDYYVVFSGLEGIGFDRNMQQKNGFYYATMGSGSTHTIKLYTKSDIEFLDVPLFVSPGLSRLYVGPGPPAPEEESKGLTLILSLILLAVFGIITYIVLYQYYKNKYEKKLFPNRNDLYNIVSYINTAKKRGLENKEIIINLKKSKWTSEQITYVMKRYEGKRTGMIELPIIKMLSNKEKKQAKKQLPKKDSQRYNLPKKKDDDFEGY